MMGNQDNNFLDRHWNDVFKRTPEHKLGWYEEEFEQMLGLIERANLKESDRIIIVGAGQTRLLEVLLEHGFINLMATDISDEAIRAIKQRVGDKVELIIDDLTEPKILPTIEPVDLWLDRAVLHFFIDKSSRNNYFTLLNQLVRIEGKVILAEFALGGAEMCSGLPVRPYSLTMMKEELGGGFNCLADFRHLYKMPSGETRPYQYALFERASMNETGFSS